MKNMIRAEPIKNESNIYVVEQILPKQDYIL